MTATELQQQLDLLGAVRCGNTVTAPCPLCQPEPVPIEKHHLSINAGASKPFVFFCHRCQTPKAQTAEERDHNRQISKRILEAAGCDTDLCFQPMEVGEIRRIWSQIALGSVVLEEDQVREADGVLHCFYHQALRHLELSDRHRKWLEKKGMDPEWCFERGYRTATELSGPKVEGVPGLVGGQWLFRPNSLLIPCRNKEWSICALKQRVTDGGKARMRLLSHRGIKASQVVHWPLLSESDQKELWITEGERKADFVYWKLQVPVCGLPGVGSWQKVVPFAQQKRQVVLALDQDEAGRKTTDQLGRLLRAQGIEVLQAQWSEGKGLDDALQLNAQLEVGEWKAVERSDDTQPPTKVKSGLTYGQPLSDHQIVPYLKEFGPQPLHQLRVYYPTVLALLREGRLRDKLTKEGRILEVAE